MVTGSLQVRNGKYYAVLNLYVDGKRKPKWIGTGLPVKGNKRKAQEFLDRVKGEYSREEVLQNSGSDILFSDFLQDWLKLVENSIEHTTLASYTNMVNARIDKHFRELGVTLGSIEPKHIQALYDEIKKQGYTPNTVIHYHAVIRKALEYAVKKELISRNPADLVDRPKKNKYIASHYSKDEMMLLFEATASDPLALVIQLAGYYGLRRSEVLGLRWSVVDFERKTIAINHKVTERTVDGKTEIVAEDKLKTKSSFRTLPLIPAVEKLLLAEKEKQKRNSALFRKGYCTDYLDYICVDETGKLIRPNFVTQHFRWVIEHYQLRKIRFHDLRHSCASLLLEAGIPMKSIQDWLGHSTFSTTADIYSHLDFSAKLEAAGAIGGLLSLS